MKSSCCLLSEGERVDLSGNVEIFIEIMKMRRIEEKGEEGGGGKVGESLRLDD